MVAPLTRMIVPSCALMMLPKVSLRGTVLSIVTVTADCATATKNSPTPKRCQCRIFVQRELAWCWLGVSDVAWLSGVSRCGGHTGWRRTHKQNLKPKGGARRQREQDIYNGIILDLWESSSKARLSKGARITDTHGTISKGEESRRSRYQSLATRITESSRT